MSIHVVQSNHGGLQWWGPKRLGKSETMACYALCAIDVAEAFTNTRLHIAKPCTPDVALAAMEVYAALAAGADRAAFITSTMTWAPDENGNTRPSFARLPGQADALFDIEGGAA